MAHEAPHPAAALLAEVNAFCDRTGMTKTAFGMKALGDPSFVGSLAKGRDLRMTTVAKVRAFMAATDEAAA